MATTVGKKFLSTPSARRATARRSPQRPDAAISIHALREEGDPKPCVLREVLCKHFYPRPPRGGRRRGQAAQYQLRPISIHALREEGDHPTAVCDGRSQTISIHALREEGDHRQLATGQPLHIFLSTPSARRATGGAPGARLCAAHFYPRPPRGGRRRAQASTRRTTRISIHALREEGDRFNEHYREMRKISIHALREEGDGRPAWTFSAGG